MIDARPDRCELCRYWPLGTFQHDFSDAPILGISGPQTDGSISDCRRRAPLLDPARWSAGGNAVWPTTGRNQWCGEFEARKA